MRLCLLCRMSAQHFPCVCVLIKPFFLLVNIQHTHWPRWFFILDRYKFYGNKTTIQATTLYQVDSSININGTIQCHCAGLWQTQHTYASYPDTLKEIKGRQRNTKWNETSTHPRNIYSKRWSVIFISCAWVRGSLRISSRSKIHSPWSQQVAGSHRKLKVIMWYSDGDYLQPMCGLLLLTSHDGYFFGLFSLTKHYY